MYCFSETQLKLFLVSAKPPDELAGTREWVFCCWKGRKKLSVGLWFWGWQWWIGRLQQQHPSPFPCSWQHLGMGLGAAGCLPCRSGWRHLLLNVWVLLALSHKTIGIQGIRLLNLILNVTRFTEHRGLLGKWRCLVTHVTDGAENCRVPSLFQAKRKRRKLSLMTNASYYSQQHQRSLCGHQLGTQLLLVQPRCADGTQIRHQEFRAEGSFERKIRHCLHYDTWYSCRVWIWFITQGSFSQATQLNPGNAQKGIKKLKYTLLQIPKILAGDFSQK